MNENDLLISIGADLSSYNASLENAKQQFNDLQKAIGKGGVRTQQARYFKGIAKEFAKEMKLVEDKTNDTINKIKYDMAQALNFGKNADKWTTEQKAALDRYYRQYVATVNAEEAKATEIKEREANRALTKQRNLDKARYEARRKVIKQLYDLGISFDYKLSLAKLSRLLKEKQREIAHAQELADRKSRLEYLISKNKKRLADEETAKQKAIAKREIDIRRKKIDTIMARFKNSSREKQAIELKRIRTLTNKELNDQVRIAKARQNLTQKTSWDFAGHRGLIDSTLVVAKYGAISQALYGVQNAFRETIGTAIQFNDILYQNRAVLNITDETLNKSLIKTVKTLGSTYGGTIAEIQDGLITIGRAGVEAGQGLSEATKVIKELSIITGDTMAEGADVISSFINVFGLAGPQIQELGDQMTYVANATRLSLQDFSTFSNYALVTAKTLNLTQEATLALAGAFSKVGLNASTIGTSLARLSKIALESTEANLSFFREVGISQEQFAKDLQDKSGKGLERFLNQLQSMGEERFTRAIKDLPELMKRTVIAMKEAGGETGFYATMLQDLNGELASTSKQAEELAKGFTPTMQSMRNAFYSAVSEGIDPFLESLSALIREWGYSGKDAAENFNHLLAEVVRITKLLVEIGLSIWAVTAFSKIGKLAKAFGTLRAEIWATRTAMLALQNLPLLLAGAGAALAYEEYQYRKKTQQGGYDSEEQRKQTIAQRDERIELELLAKTYEEADTLANSYTKTLKTLQETNINGVNDAAIAGLEKQIKVQKDITFQLETYWGMHKKVAKDIKDSPIGAETADALPALPYEETAKAIAAQKKMLLLQEAMQGKLTSEQIARKEINIDIEAQEAAVRAAGDALAKAGGIVGSKEYKEAVKAVQKLTELEFRRYKLLQKQKEGGGREAREQYRLSKAELELAILTNQAKLTGLEILQGGNLTRQQQYEFDVAQAKMAYALQEDAVIKAYENLEAAKDATTEAKAKADLQKQINKLGDIELRKLKKQVEYSKRFSKTITDVVSSISSGDWAGAFEGIGKSLMEEFNVESFGDSFSTLLDSMMNGFKGFSDAMDSVLKSSLWGIILWGGSKIISALTGGIEAPPPVTEEYRQTSDSINNTLTRLLDVQYPMLSLTREMTGYLRNISNEFTGLGTNLLLSGLDLGGQLFQPEFQLSSHGLSSREYSLESTVIDIDAASIADIIVGDIYGQLETTILKEYRSFWKDKDTRFLNVDDITNLISNELATVTKNIYDSVTATAEALDIEIPSLDDFVIDIGRFETTGMSADEIAAEINARYSANIDQIMEEVFGGIMTQFRQEGEGLYETAIRVATNMDQVTHSLDMIGISLQRTDETVTTTLGGIGGAILKFLTGSNEVTRTYTTYIFELTEAMIEGAGSIDALQSSIKTYLENFFTEQEQYDAQLRSLTAQFKTLGYDIPKTKEEFKALAESIDVNSVEGAKLFGEFIGLAGSFSELINMAEELNGALKIDLSPIEAIADAWLSEMSYLTNAQKTIFADAYYDIIKDLQAVNEDVSLVDAARSAAEQALKTTTTKEEFIPYFERYIDALENEVEDATLNDVVRKLDEVVDIIKETNDDSLRTITDVRIVT